MFHPALPLFFVSCLLIGGQVLQGRPLVAGCAVALGLATLLARPRLIRLLRRSRYLLLAIGVMFAFFTPGQRLLADASWFPLTVEGLALAATHGGRLLIAIALVAVLLQRMQPGDLVQGLAVLSSPLRLLGADPRRLAVRLSLVLEMVADQRQPDWKHWLDAPAADSIPSSIRISARRFGWPDGLALAAMLGLMVTLWLHGNA